MDFENPQIFVGAISIAVATFSLLNAAITAAFNRRRERRRQTVDLYRSYYTPENTRKIVTPVFALMLKWESFQDEKFESLKAAVRRAWIGANSDPDRVLSAFVPAEVLAMDCETAHFHYTQSGDQFTEQEALTAFLRFWTMVDQMIEAKVIDKKLTRSLFIGTYAYYRGFFKDLRDDMRPFAEGYTLTWIDATERLDKIFKP